MAGNDTFIDFLIKPDGKIEIEMEGFKGQGCAAEAEHFIKKLGKAVDSKKTSEYYQEEKKQSCQRINK